MNQTCLTWRIPAGKIPANLSRIIPAQTSALEEASRSIPEGAYTTFRTFLGNRALRPNEHLARLENTARLAGHQIKLNTAGIRELLREAVRELPHPGADLRIRVTLDLSCSVGEVYLSLEPLRAPTLEQVQSGVWAETRRLHRENPQAKLTAFMHQAEKVRSGLPHGVYEIIMIGDDGQLLEGLSSNFYAVLDGVLWTAQAGVLPGVTRQIVLEEARVAGLPIHLEGLPQNLLAQISEAFLTSSSRAVLPITKVDEMQIGTGAPGPITQRLLAAYQDRIERESELI